MIGECLKFLKVIRKAQKIPAICRVVFVLCACRCLSQEWRRIRSQWRQMKNRCMSKNNHWYHIYGGRGIKVCEGWLVFENYFDWYFHQMEKHAGEENLTVDRIDTNGDYSPENCRLATLKEQANNRRTTKYFLSRSTGEKKSISQWADLHGVRRVAVELRLKFNGDPALPFTNYIQTEFELSET